MDKEERECKACEALRKGLTWIGDPPKCRKHEEKVEYNKYWQKNNWFPIGR